MPYEEISVETFENEVKNLKALDFTKIENRDPKKEDFCDNDTCKI